MNPCELTASVTALANLIAAKLDEDELAVMASIFVQLGDTLETIAAQRALCCNKKTSKCKCIHWQKKSGLRRTFLFKIEIRIT